MTVTVTMSNSEAIFTVSAIQSQVEKFRTFLQETDAEFGDMNNIHRTALQNLKKVHVNLIAGLRLEGYPIYDDDIVDLEGDEVCGAYPEKKGD